MSRHRRRSRWGHQSKTEDIYRPGEALPSQAAHLEMPDIERIDVGLPDITFRQLLYTPGLYPLAQRRLRLLEGLERSLARLYKQKRKTAKASQDYMVTELAGTIAVNKALDEMRLQWEDVQRRLQQAREDFASDQRVAQKREEADLAEQDARLAKHRHDKARYEAQEAYAAELAEKEIKAQIAEIEAQLREAENDEPEALKRMRAQARAKRKIKNGAEVIRGEYGSEEEYQQALHEAYEEEARANAAPDFGPNGNGNIA